MELLNYKICSTTGLISFKKPIIVFLHGFGGSSAIWLKQIKALKNKYDLVLIDLPSHGKNNLQLSNMTRSFDEIINKILDVLSHLNIKKANFIGCSLGTIFVKNLVIKKKEVVDKFVLIGGIGSYKTWLKLALRGVIFLLNFIPVMFGFRIASKLIIPKKESKESRNIFIECAKRMNKKEFILWLKLLTKFPKVNKEYIKKLHTIDNGLYIEGDNDYMFYPTLKKELKIFHNIKIIKDCGHVCNIDKSEEVNELLQEFI